MQVRSKVKGAMWSALLLLVLFAGGCRRETVSPPPPIPPAPPPAAARPTVTLQAEPAFIQRGEGATLRWSSTNATRLELAPGIGRPLQCGLHGIALVSVPDVRTGNVSGLVYGVLWIHRVTG